MASTLPSNFKKDIQGKDTFLIPLVVILDRVSTANDINISTNSINISHKADPNNTAMGTFKPILLNIPSLKESIDFESRKYKI